uniref:Protein kinase domain-containing protein n=1 Tax=Acrobeloides nanus TaxID=290746 RepID=A0A914D8H4_9BILA
RLYRYTDQYLMRRCVLHETDSYALVIEMAYGVKTDMMSSINASDLDQPPGYEMMVVSLCVESL